jgi:ferredoxin
MPELDLQAVERNLKTSHADTVLRGDCIALLAHARALRAALAASTNCDSCESVCYTCFERAGAVLAQARDVPGEGRKT